MIHHGYFFESYIGAFDNKIYRLISYLNADVDATANVSAKSIDEWIVLANDFIPW